MRHDLERCRTIVVTLVVAALLVVQSAIGAFASPSGIPEVDAFGNPLCLAGSIAGQGETQSDKNSKALPQCCTMACPIMAGLMPAGSDGVPLVNPLSHRLQRLSVQASEPAFVDPDHRPGLPRAPPAAL